MGKTYYEILGVPEDATGDQIRRAFRKIALHKHPDITKTAQASEQFMLIKEAYETLNDPDKRRAYDLALQEERNQPVKITLEFSRPSLPILSEEQILYILLEFIPQSQSKQSPSPPVNLCLLIDRSTSMQGERLDMVKAAANNLVNLLGGNDILSIVAFSDFADVILPANRISNSKIIQGQIRSIITGGATEIFQGLQSAVDEIKRFSKQTAINHIFFFTDGKTYGDEEKCIKLAEDARQQGIGISCIGIGEDWNDEFLDSLAAITGSNTVYIHNPKDISGEVADIFSNLKDVLADQVTLKLTHDSRVKLESAFRLTPNPSPIPIEESLRLGHLPKKSKLSILLEYLIQPLEENNYSLQIASGETSISPASIMEKNFSIPLSFIRLTGSLPDTFQPPQAIRHALMQINYYRMQEKAQEDLAQGKLDSAKYRLRKLANQLLVTGKKQLAETVMFEVQQLEKKMEMTKFGKKQIKYGTRALWLPEPKDERSSQA